MAGAEVGRPEVLLINRYVKLRTATGNIASALGFLALLWSTVVLLGGFIDDLLLKEFWVLTALSFLMSFRMAEIINNELSKGIYMEEDKIIDTLRQQEWFEPHGRESMVVIMLRVVQVLKWIFAACFFLLHYFSPFVNLGVAVWRLVRRDYGDAGGDIAKRSKLNAALDIFYGLILFQSLFAFYYIVIFRVRDNLLSRTEKHCGLEEIRRKAIVAIYSSARLFKKDEKCKAIVDFYSSETERKSENDGERKAIIGIYYSETARKFKKDGELPDNWNLIAYGVELLQSASGEDHLWGARVLDQLFGKDKSVRQKLLSSRISVQNLIGMIGLRGTAENVENRERAARIVVHLASDLNIAHFPGTLQCICSLLESCQQSFEPQVTSPSENPDVPDKMDQNGSETVLHIKDQPEHESGRAKKMISRGLLILGRLAQDEENCKEISKHQSLLSKITSPLSSHDFLSNLRGAKRVKMLRRSLTLVSKLLASPGDGATRLRQELAGNKEAVSNLMAILETDSEGAQQLHGQALEILTELALDDSFIKLDFGESTSILNQLFSTLQHIFLKEMVAEEGRERATRLRAKAGEALARLIPIRAAGILSKQDAINLFTKVLNQILSSEMGKAHGNEKPSEERKFMAAMLSLAVVTCNENVISKDDFAHATPEDAALVKKLKEILNVNKHKTAECLRIVKLICQVMIAMIEVNPSCIQHLNEHNLKKALTKASKTMLEVDDCKLFAGIDHEVIKPARSLASLVKETQELLNTAQEQGK